MNDHHYYSELRRIKREAYQDYLRGDLDDRLSETFAKSRNDRDIRDLQKMALENPAQFTEIMKLDGMLLGAENIGFQREQQRDRKINRGGEVMPEDDIEYTQPQIGSSDVIDVSDFWNI